MGKEVRNSSIETADINALKDARKSLIFSPNHAQRKAKAKFWTRMDTGLGSPNLMSAAIVSEIIGEAAVKKWWSLPGFREWFFNEQEAKERLEYLFMLALDSAEYILLDENANASAKVQMIKVLAALSGKDQEREQKLLDEKIQKMDMKQLQEYIKRTAPKLIEGEIVANKELDD